MRKIGTLESAKAAERFHRYLMSIDIENQVDEQPPVWEVWVTNDEQLEAAKAELESFANFPDDPRFALKNLPPAKKKRQVAQPTQRRPGSSEIPVTRFLIVGSVLMTIYTGMGTLHREVMYALKFSKYVKPDGLFSLPPEIMRGEVWRIFTPAFVHGSVFHLLFNMYFLWILGNTIERTKGSGRFLLYCLITAAGAHFTQYFVVGPNFIGISGVVYGLLGFLWMKQMVAPEEGYYVPDMLVVQMLIWLFLGISGVLESWGIPVANGAHFGGLLAGMLIATVPSRKPAQAK